MIKLGIHILKMIIIKIDYEINCIMGESDFDHQL